MRRVSLRKEMIGIAAIQIADVEVIQVLPPSLRRANSDKPGGFGSASFHRQPSPRCSVELATPPPAGMRRQIGSFGSFSRIQKEKMEQLEQSHQDEQQVPPHRQSQHDAVPSGSDTDWPAGVAASCRGRTESHLDDDDPPSY